MKKFLVELCFFPIYLAIDFIWKLKLSRKDLIGWSHVYKACLCFMEAEKHLKKI